MPGQQHLNRFHKAQDSTTKGRTVYDIASEEMLAGHKTSHWIWYIFPQLKTMGFSQTSKFYGLRNFAEACNYLRDPVLFKRYNDMVTIAQAKLTAGVPVLTLMNGKIDAKKLASSLTLFRAAASYLASLSEGVSHECANLEKRCSDTLKIMSTQGYGECAKTMADHSVQTLDMSDGSEDRENESITPDRSLKKKPTAKLNHPPKKRPTLTVSSDSSDSDSDSDSKPADPFESAKKQLRTTINLIADTTIQAKANDVLTQILTLYPTSSRQDKQTLLKIVFSTHDLLNSSKPRERQQALESYKQLADAAQGRPASKWKILGGIMMLLGAAVAVSGAVLVAGGVIPVGAILIGVGAVSFISGTNFFRSKGLSRAMHDLANLKQADKPPEPRNKK